MIKLQTYKLDNLILTSQIIDSYINKFWDDVFSTIKDNKHLMILCKADFNDSELGHKSLGHLRRVNYSDKQLFIDYLSARLGILNESYTTHPILSITFSYIIKPGLASGNRMLLQDLEDRGVIKHRFNNMDLPISMNPADYGNILLNNIVEVTNSTINRFIVESGARSYVIDVSSDGLVNKVRIQGSADLSWVDTKISDEIFKREIGKSIIFFMEGQNSIKKKTAWC